MTKDSDIDLLIVEREPVNRHDEAVSIENAIGDVNYPVDVTIIATDRFEATRHIIGGIAHPAHKYGKILYDSRSAGLWPAASKQSRSPRLETFPSVIPLMSNYVA